MTKNTSPIEVLVALPLDTALVQTIQEVSPRLRVTVHPARQEAAMPVELWARCEVLFTRDLTPIPETAPNLRWIQCQSPGIHHLIEAPILSKPGLLLTTSSGAIASQAAEHALGMLLALGRQLPAWLATDRKPGWPKDAGKAFVPGELRGSTVGIVGYGSVGRQVARLLHGFGATVLATKADAMHPADSGYSPEGLGDPQGNLVHRLYPAEAMRSMLRECDFIVICLPRTARTAGIVSADTLAACNPHAYLVDVSAGGIVDHAALARALNDHKLSGAALELSPEEPITEKSPLWKVSNLILTPSIAGASQHYEKRVVDLFAENLSRYLADLPLYNLVDPKRGY